MHYALPPRKSSRPHPYATLKSSHPPWLRKGRIRALAIVLVLCVTGLFVVSRSRKTSHGPAKAIAIPKGTPQVVLVTTLDPAFAGQYERKIVENRISYARAHGECILLSHFMPAVALGVVVSRRRTTADTRITGYATFLPNQTDYDLSNPSGITARSWAKIPAVRHAMALHPHSTYFFYLDQHALIMRPDLPVSTLVTDPTRLTSLLIPNKPVVPPDSIIHTSTHPSAANTDAIFTQDSVGISPTSFLLRQGEWANFFLDAWFDPLYRSYNFQRAEGHALEHLVQWHPTVLARFGLVPQRTINSYAPNSGGEAWQEGDFVASWMDCVRVGSGKNCEKEAKPFVERLAVDERKGSKEREG